MRGLRVKQYFFDEVLRFLTILVLVLFGGFLVMNNSDLSRDVTLLVIGVIGGRYFKA